MSRNKYNKGVTDIIKGGETSAMSPNPGRPRANNPKSVRFSIRLDIETFKRLEEYCKQNGMRKSEAIRNAIVLYLMS